MNENLILIFSIGEYHMKKIISGKKIAKEIRKEIKIKVTKLIENGITPKLTVILVGENTASKVYVRNKERACKKVGIISETIILDKNITEKNLLNKITELNNDKSVNGILVQLPIPKHIDEQKIILNINPEKDVDGFHPINLGKLMLGLDTFYPCTPSGVLELLNRYNIEISGKNVAIVGRSNIVGKPLANMLIQKGIDATVTVCHSRTKNLKEITSSADILIAAIGKPEFITNEYVKDGAIVVDVGINEKIIDGEFHLVGDVDFEDVYDKIAMITPVPGGIGPMTIAMLLENTLNAVKIQNMEKI